MKRHPIDVVSLVFGLIFVGIAGWWLVYTWLGFSAPFGWVVAVALIVIGTIGLLAAIRPGRGRAERRDDTGGNGPEPTDTL